MLIQEPKGGKTAFLYVEHIKFLYKIKAWHGEAWVIDEWECVLVIFYSPEMAFQGY